MHLLDAVAGTLALEAVPLHHAGRPAALAGAGHVYEGNAFEQVDREHLPNLDPLVDPSQLADEPLRFAVGLGYRDHAPLSSTLSAATVEFCDLTPHALACKPAGLVTKSDLHRGVAIAVGGADAHHRAGPSLDDRHGHDGSIGVKDLGHPDLAAQEALAARLVFRHRSSAECACRCRHG